MRSWNKPLAWAYISLISLFVFILDRLSKTAILENFSQGESSKVFPNFLHITVVFNSGAAFGLLKNMTPFFIVVSFVVLAVIVLYVVRAAWIDFAVSVALGLVAGGAAGNLVDRIKLGYVIDFLDIRVWPVFNIADSAITIGASLLVLHVIFGKSIKRKT